VVVQVRCRRFVGHGFFLGRTVILPGLDATERMPVHSGP
jgi:hypothetical protein